MVDGLNCKKINTRALLFDAAERLFVAKGYSAVSTREIAEAAGVNLAAIQYHFGSKANLFIETVRQPMTQAEARSPFAGLDRELTTPDAAANLLVTFIHTFLDNLCNPTGPEVCRIIYREIFSETSHDPEISEALVSSVVEEFYRPRDAMLLRVLNVVRPDLSDSEIGLFAHTVIGQCTFYVTHKPFIVALRGKDFSDRSLLKIAADHIAKVTLRGLGLSEERIVQAMQGVVIPFSAKKRGNE